MNNFKGVSDGLVIGFSYSVEGDFPILLVGRKNEKQDTEIINALEGSKAIDVYKALIERG